MFPLIGKCFVKESVNQKIMTNIADTLIDDAQMEHHYVASQD